MKLRIKGNEIPSLNPDTASVHDMMELQKQSGLKITEIRDYVKLESYALAISAFLSMHNAGLHPEWANVIATPMKEFGVIAEPGDEARLAAMRAKLEGEQRPDPQQGPISALDAPAPPAPGRKPGSGSKQKSHGSKRR